MNLSELLEPIFLYICKIRRVAKNKGALNFSDVRAEVGALLERAALGAKQNSALSIQYEKIKLPLVFFIDSMIVESGINFSAQWHDDRLGYKFDELAGDEAFFDYLEETLADSSDEASTRLVFFYTCLGLGFSGFYFGQADKINAFISQILPRIRKYLEMGEYAKITPDAYLHVDTTNFVVPSGDKITLILIIFFIFLFSVLGAVAYMYRQSSSELSDAIGFINDYSAPSDPDIKNK